MSLDKFHVIQRKAHLCYTIIGKKGSGKSALLERMGSTFHDLGRVVLDLNGSPDLEQLHWCIPDTDRPKDKQVAYPILLIVPKTTEITTDSRTITTPTGNVVTAIKMVSDDTPLKDIIAVAHEERRVVVFNIYLYDNPSRGQKKLSDIIFSLPNTLRDHVPTNISLVVALRELADLSSNRMKTHKGQGETESKRSLTWISRQIRHFRTSLIVDTQNLQDLYSAFVSNQDILLVKNINMMSIPPTMTWWINDLQGKVGFAKAHYMVDKLQLVSPDRLSHNSFYAIYPDMDYRLFHNAEPVFRHHRPDDDAKALAGITIHYMSKTEVENITSLDRVAVLHQKASAKGERIELLNTAYQLYRQEKLKDPTITWDEIAKKVRFLGADDKPKGNSLRMAIDREASRGNIEGYLKQT